MSQRDLNVCQKLLQLMFTSWEDTTSNQFRLLRASRNVSIALGVCILLAWLILGFLFFVYGIWIKLTKWSLMSSTTDPVSMLGLILLEKCDRSERRNLCTCGMLLNLLIGIHYYEVSVGSSRSVLYQKNLGGSGQSRKNISRSVKVGQVTGQVINNINELIQLIITRHILYWGRRSIVIAKYTFFVVDNGFNCNGF